jgi:molecular chaperone GrpE
MAESRNYQHRRSGKVTEETTDAVPDAVEEAEKSLVETPEGIEQAPVEDAEQPLPAEGEEEQAADELTILREELEEVKTREAEYLDGWQRARAELANARKRFQREREQTYANARADVLARLLPIVDDLERAFETLPHNLSNLTWIQGMVLIQRKLQLLLEQDGVVAIEAVGQEFDPFLHQAVTHEPSSTVPVGHIISELQKGYRLDERVLRPSMVRVSAGPPPTPETEPEAEQEEGESPAEGEPPAEENPSTDPAQA